MVYYGELVHFANSPSYNNMYEANLTKQIYAWVGAAKDELDPSYYFTVTYIFNYQGVAVDANILVQKKNSSDEWITIGTYTPLGTPLLQAIECLCEDVCVESDFPSNPIPFFVWNDCNIVWNNISFLWNNRWPKP